jgi:superfamily II DNA helicase RecQ
MVASEPPLSVTSMLKIKGVGSKKMEKYGAKFLDLLDHAG